MKRALVGAGGFSTDVRALMDDPDILCFVDDEYYDGHLVRPHTCPLSEFDPEEYELFVTIANPIDRKRIVESLPKGTKFFNVIHPTAQLTGREIEIGIDCVISAGCLLSDKIKIGNHCQFNLGSMLGHDVTIGDYFTCAPGVKIMGSNKIGNLVYFGTNACSKEKITVVDNVVVGLNGGVVSNLMEAGTYVGTPARRIKNKKELAEVGDHGEAY